MDSSTIRMWIARFMLLTLVSSIVIYVVTLESLPEKARIHSGIDSGLYYRIASEIAPSITERSSVPVEVVPSNGSIANITALEQGESEFAIVQGTVDFSRFAIVTPLYPDVMPVSYTHLTLPPKA